MERTLQFFIAVFFLWQAPATVLAQVRINEYSASNWNGQFKDNYNSDEDWFELYNNSATATDISGYFLSDDETNPAKWEIPSGSYLHDLNVSDHHLASGIYILRFNAGKFVKNIKVTIAGNP